MHFGGFNHINPLPIEFEDILPEELQTITINLDRAPGMEFDQLREIDFQSLCRELIRAALEVLLDACGAPGA